MNTTAKSIYLFLSHESDFVAFSFILTKTRKTVEGIDSIEQPLFSMVWRKASN